MAAIPAATFAAAPAPCDSCYERCLNVAVKSNLLHDALLTPDFGVELALPHRISVSVDGVCAWWSRAAAHRYWRVRGVWAGINYWFGAAAHRRYGYSFRLNSRLSLDLSVRAGYTGGHITVYKPQCGTYVCVDSYYRRYIGPTDVSVTLVWFPGRGAFNNPER